MVLVETLAGKSLVRKLRNVLGVCGHGFEKLFQVHFRLSRRQRRGGSTPGRFFNQTPNITLRRQTASLLNLGCQLIRNFDGGSAYAKRSRPDAKTPLRQVLQPCSAPACMDSDQCAFAREK